MTDNQGGQGKGGHSSLDETPDEVSINRRASGLAGGPGNGQKLAGLLAIAALVVAVVLINRSAPKPAAPKSMLDPSTKTAAQQVVPFEGLTPDTVKAIAKATADKLGATAPTHVPGPDEAALSQIGPPAAGGVPEKNAASIAASAQRSPVMAISLNRTSENRTSDRAAGAAGAPATAPPSLADLQKTLAAARAGVGVGVGDKAASPDAHTSTDLENLRKASAIGEAKAGLLPNRNYLITAGTLIPCTLQTALDSTQPGYASCIIPHDVYSDNGRVILMEKGTKVLGEYRANLTQGQYRLFVLWNRAVTPKGVAIDLSSPASDALGKAGMDGTVETFFMQRFGAALMLSLVDDASTIAVERYATSGSGETIRLPSQVANTALQGTISIRPVLHKNQGEDVAIYVAKDANFADVYQLRLSAQK